MTLFNKSLITPDNATKSFPTYWGGGSYSSNQYVYTLPDTTTKIWYENRDGFHADFEYIFTDTIRQTSGVTGFGISWYTKFLNGIVIANSSTANDPSDETSGSNTRVLDSGPLYYHMMRDAWKQGYLQFFPEHRDYDLYDWFKVNQPYVVTTQGSSGSETEELYRCNEIVKALKPEVREWMIANQRVGDVVAYLMRSNLPGGYLEPKNHRPVTSTTYASNEDLALAASLTIETMPPTFEIRVVSDSLDKRDSVRTAEVIGLKRTDLSKTRVIEVELISDKPNVIFHWITGQGKSTIVAIGNRATITIPFQSDFEVETQDGHKLISNRMDVMAVAFDGTHYSCPVFISEYTTPEARELVPRMNELAIAADDSFVCNVNGVEVGKGSHWNQLSRIPYAWKQGNNLVEIAVTNAGGPGGLLASLFVGEVETASDKYWEASLDGTSWETPDYVTPYGQGPWASNVIGVRSDTKAQWIWIARAPELSTVYFRKTIVIGTPTPEPNPNPTPDQSAEIERLRAELALEKRNYSSLDEMYDTKVNECEAVLSKYNASVRKLSDLKIALNEVLK